MVFADRQLPGEWASVGEIRRAHALGRIAKLDDAGAEALQGLQPSVSRSTRESDRLQQASSEALSVRVSTRRACVAEGQPDQWIALVVMLLLSLPVLLSLISPAGSFSGAADPVKLPEERAIASGADNQYSWFLCLRWRPNQLRSSWSGLFKSKRNFASQS